MQYFTAPEDMQLALRSFKKLRQALASKAFENITVGPDHGEVAPGASVQSDEDLMQ